MKRPKFVVQVEAIVKLHDAYNRQRMALRKIADLVDSEAGEPLDEAIKIAETALKEA